MRYEEAVHYIEEVPKFTKKTTLEHTRKILNRLGNPQKELRVIHVAGTNGKGSVCAYLNSMLTEGGYVCGLFTSPHLIRINERFMIGGCPVDDDTFLEAFQKVMEASRQVMEEEQESHHTYFEILFLMGLSLIHIYWYIEMVKPRLYSETEAAKASALWTLKTVLTNALKMLHPFMPFITEEIFCTLNPEEESIMISSWPEYRGDWEYAQAAEEVELMKEAVRGIRNVRTQLNVPPSKKASVYVAVSYTHLDVYKRQQYGLDPESHRGRKRKRNCKAGAGTENRNPFYTLRNGVSCDPARRACVAVQCFGCYNEPDRIPLRCGGNI